ncbi:hypothetical protein D0X99_10210 [Algoriphagus lacus]|uniref:Uncharacterized protein n=1 Tax=Algoriphagus lacus TaxID=2056311 RepID=A0A418PS71_9BACT|nr:hypothetical protein D0X99_10210 [Algoriphagus lacus]
MKKQKIALFLSLTWLIGMIAVFSFPPTLDASTDSSNEQSIIQKISSPEILLRTSSESLEIPPFKIDWRFNGFLYPPFSVEYFTVYPIYLSSSFYDRSNPLFDILITFFHYFHTW